jgi:hypothetical protein
MQVDSVGVPPTTTPTPTTSVADDDEDIIVAAEDDDVCLTAPTSSSSTSSSSASSSTTSSSSAATPTPDNTTSTSSSISKTREMAVAKLKEANALPLDRLSASETTQAYGWTRITPTRLPDISQQKCGAVQHYLAANNFVFHGLPLEWRIGTAGNPLYLRAVDMPAGWGLYYISANVGRGQLMSGLIVDSNYRAYVHYIEGSPHVESGIYPIYDRMSDYLQLDPREIVVVGKWMFSIFNIRYPHHYDAEVFAAVGIGDVEKRKSLVVNFKVPDSVLAKCKPHTPADKNQWHSSAVRTLANRTALKDIPILFERSIRADEHVRRIGKLVDPTQEHKLTDEQVGQFEKMLMGISGELSKTTNTTATTTPTASTLSSPTNLATPTTPLSSTATSTTSTTATSASTSTVPTTTTTPNSKPELPAATGPSKKTAPPMAFDGNTLKQDRASHYLSDGDLDDVVSQLLPAMLKKLTIEHPEARARAIATIKDKTVATALRTNEQRFGIKLDPLLSAEISTMASTAATACDKNVEKLQSSAAIELIKKRCRGQENEGQLFFLHVEMYAAVFAAIEKFILLEDKPATTSVPDKDNKK